jgi:hypothetical protein
MVTTLADIRNTVVQAVKDGIEDLDVIAWCNDAQIEMLMHVNRDPKQFTAITDTIEVEDRFAPLYTTYCQAQYYDLPRVMERLGVQQAQRQYEKHYTRHLTIKEQIATELLMRTPPYTIQEEAP